jgi:glycogen operon protein
MNESVIYEMHVGGFTRGVDADVTHPGTFSAVIEKIPYLKSLGVTAVELLPVFEFDDSDMRMHGDTPLRNYWGYSTMAYFAPHSGYCVAPESGSHADEFRDMVKALHKAGIEVILDVVFNHTDEGNHQGPIFSFKGFANETYYYLDSDKRYYMDYSGCGNSLNANQPVVSKLVLDCLLYWVEDMHVDGFRFDEASVLSRGENGAPMEHPPVLWQIELNETLAETKLIAEAWDAAGLYQVGHFPGYRWAEWNGRFRDDMRRFVRSDAGQIDIIRSRFCGSPDLYQAINRLPINSINFIDAHDGFTIADLVAFNRKHNDGNGEGNRDGVDDNLSWNCGVEGQTDDPEILSLRERQIKNFAAVLLLSQGVPMFVMGDEVQRSQGGNNNAYCQDNPIGWFNWLDPQRHAAMLRFWQEMIAFRRQHASLLHPHYFTGAVNKRGLADLTWHGVKLNEPDLGEDSRSLAFTLGAADEDADIHVIANMYWEPLTFALPTVTGRTWRRAFDTALSSSPDNSERNTEICPDGFCRAEGRSVVVLVNS